MLFGLALENMGTHKAENTISANHCVGFIDGAVFEDYLEGFCSRRITGVRPGVNGNKLLVCMQRALWQGRNQFAEKRGAMNYYAWILARKIQNSFACMRPGSLSCSMLAREYGRLKQSDSITYHDAAGGVDRDRSGPFENPSFATREYLF